MNQDLLWYGLIEIFSKYFTKLFRVDFRIILNRPRRVATGWVGGCVGEGGSHFKISMISIKILLGRFAPFLFTGKPVLGQYSSLIISQSPLTLFKFSEYVKERYVYTDLFAKILQQNNQ